MGLQKRHSVIRSLFAELERKYSFRPTLLDNQTFRPVNDRGMANKQLVRVFRGNVILLY